MFTHDLIKSGESVKAFRETLLEASYSFTPGSAAELIYKFYLAGKKYYLDLLVHEFQMYSNGPKQQFNLFRIDTFLTDDRISKLEISPGNGDILDVLKNLNTVPANNIHEVIYSFRLNPPLKDLQQSIANDYYSELFTKEHQLTINQTNGKGYEGTFRPEWTDTGLILHLSGLKLDISKEVDLLKPYATMVGGF